ncbi:uncharacterized protein N7503_006892 [Penicillium pulvis]|uniref:uncharacterized protein n=1 Tax=Penicillium pulvis TaxID=1562058 RepID=UPI0025498FF4|nr:uncharacterized protein N7503_006892 [Penicillium pulvis]KAJ5797596.1 hypothetical protein N7503_006892 [Penicillium pulvis]
MEATPPSERDSRLKPVHLLWNYELRRTNQILTERLLQTKRTVNEAEEVNDYLCESLKDLIGIMSSLMTANMNSAEDDQSLELRKLQRQFKRTLKAVNKYTKATDEKSDAMINCISAIGLLLGQLKERAAANKTRETRIKTEPQENTTMTDAAQYQQTTRQSASTHPFVKQEEQEEALTNAEIEANLKSRMKQNGRPLELYFEGAKLYRIRMRAIRPNNDIDHIGPFLAGLDNNLYRRRIVHWLRQETYDWPWLEHIVLCILSEEEYFAKQDYALAHQSEDGSVLLPDGTRQHRFVILQPITAEDLTDSEVEEEEEECGNNSHEASGLR